MKDSNFLNDIDKMYDFLALTKDEFLFSYDYLTEQEYDNTLRLFNEDRGTNLAYLLREAENLLLEESNGRDTPWNLTGEELKDRVCDYAWKLNYDEQKVFQEVASSMAC